MAYEKRLQPATPLAESEREADQAYRRYTLDLLHHTAVGMNLDNFMVPSAARWWSATSSATVGTASIPSMWAS